MLRRLLSLATFVAVATNSEAALANFLPANTLHLQDSLMSASGISKEEFDSAIAEANEAFAPVVSAFGAKLTFNPRWTDGTVNASAQQIGSTWYVNMYGGLARRKEITQDGFSLVICHELGHHLAGYPFTGNSSVMASEGQSDYWATQTCARTLWRGKYADNKRLGELASEPAKAMCMAKYADQEENRDLCNRVAAAGESAANLLAAVGGSSKPSPDTPDKKVVSRTVTSHPQAQCRLDTYLNGAKCKMEFDLTVIPGKENSAKNGSDSERSAFLYSCSVTNAMKDESRPNCWFKALTE